MPAIIGVLSAKRVGRTQQNHSIQLPSKNTNHRRRWVATTNDPRLAQRMADLRSHELQEF